MYISLGRIFVSSKTAVSGLRQRGRVGVADFHHVSSCVFSQSLVLELLTVLYKGKQAQQASISTDDIY
jgi:hypothetical protein